MPPPPLPPGPKTLGTVVESDDGQLVSVSARILERIRAGAFEDTAAASAGVPGPTYRSWLKQAADVTSSGKDRRLYTPREREIVDFARNVSIAVAEHEVFLEAQLQRLSSPRESRVVTEKIDPSQLGADGRPLVIERTERTESVDPDARVIMFRLSRRHPDRYSGRTEITGPNGSPVQADVAVWHSLAESARAARAAAQPVGEVTSGVDVEPDS